MENKTPYGTVLIKAEKIIGFLADHPQSSLTDISKASGLTPSTTSKILDTLVLIGFVKKEETAKTYSIGSKLIRYANKALDQIDLVELSHDSLLELQEKIDETIHLGILSNNSILYVDKIEPKNQTIFMSSKIGITRPLYSSAMGKAVLAEFSKVELANYLEETPLTPYTIHTITNQMRLVSELAEVRQLEVAFDDEEMEKDIFCCGAALVVNDAVIGAFSVSMPKYRLTNKEYVVEEVKATKYKLEAILNQSM